MAEVAGTVLNADSREDPGVIVQHLGEERGHGLIAAKPFVKGQTIIREKVINNSIHLMKITILNLLISTLSFKYHQNNNFSIYKLTANCIFTIFMERICRI